MQSNKPILGVALTKCYFCQKDDQIILNTRLTPECASSVEAMNGKTLNLEPCRECAGYMEQGIILITIDPAKSGAGWEKAALPNPYRTGGWFVLREAAVARMFTGEALAFALKHRWIFIKHAAAVSLGLYEVCPAT